MTKLEENLPYRWDSWLPFLTVADLLASTQRVSSCRGLRAVGNVGRILRNRGRDPSPKREIYYCEWQALLWSPSLGSSSWKVHAGDSSGSSGSLSSL